MFSKFKIFSSILTLGIVFTLTTYADEQFKIGKFQSRAIFRTAKNMNESDTAPLIILIPGSGANGPEEMMPPALTADGKEHSLFSEFSAPLNEGGIHTLAVGKPGVDFFPGWDHREQWFYDQTLYKNLHWQDLIDNVSEAVKFSMNLPQVDKNHIYLLGHSEGTQVVVDYASKNSDVVGLILLGYSGEDMASILDWQLFKRAIEFFVEPDVDTNKDGIITREEASKWPELSIPWQDGQSQISIEEIEVMMRNYPPLQEIYHQAETAPLYDNGIFKRGSLYDLTASLKQSLYIFTGELDVQTPAREAQKLKNTCDPVGRTNCQVTIVPGLGHGFSEPKSPRKHPLLDITLGPVDVCFQEILLNLAESLTI